MCNLRKETTRQQKEKKLSFRHPISHFSFTYPARWVTGSWEPEAGTEEEEREGLVDGKRKFLCPGSLSVLPRTWEATRMRWREHREDRKDQGLV